MLGIHYQNEHIHNFQIENIYNNYFFLIDAMNMKSGFLSIFLNQCWECVMQYELHVVVYTVSYGVNGAINVKIGIFYTLILLY